MSLLALSSLSSDIANCFVGIGGYIYRFMIDRYRVKHHRHDGYDDGYRNYYRSRTGRFNLESPPKKRNKACCLVQPSGSLLAWLTIPAFCVAEKPADEFPINRLMREARRAILASISDYNRALENYEKISVFTYALLMT